MNGLKLGKTQEKKTLVFEFVCFSIIAQFLYIFWCIFCFLVCERNTSSCSKSLSVIFKLSMFYFNHFLREAFIIKNQKKVGTIGFYLVFPNLEIGKRFLWGRKKAQDNESFLKVTPLIWAIEGQNNESYRRGLTIKKK